MSSRLVFDSLADFRSKIREVLSYEKDLYRDDGFYFCL